MLKWAKHQPQTRQFQSISALSELREQRFDRLRPKKRYSTHNLIERPQKMPTVTSQRRHSLTGNANKENLGIYFARSPYRSGNMTAFQDLSNGKSPLRPEADSRLAARRRTINIAPLTVRNQESPELALGRFSDDFAGPDDHTPLSRIARCGNFKEESLSSSQMGDVTLDRMLDAIIESARKEVRTISLPQQPLLQLQPRDKREVCESSIYGDVDLEDSIHEMEVRTPPHLKRQRVVRRKNTRTTSTRNARKDPQAPQAHIGGPNPGALTDATPATCVLSGDDSDGARAVDAYSKPNEAMTRSSTPTLEEAHSIKRCLSFSSASDEDDADYSAAKRSSVASSNASSMAGDYFCSGRTSRSSQSSLKAASVMPIKGALELAAYVAGDMLNVHVIRCRDLQRANGSTALNAYVKVALITKMSERERQLENGFHRTAVHRHSSRPYFDQHFRFDLPSHEHSLNAEDRLQLTVWHRDRRLKRSEFLGCMSLPLQSLLRHPINGNFKLQSRTCLNNPQPPTLLPPAITQANHNQPNRHAGITQPEPQPIQPIQPIQTIQPIQPTQPTQSSQSKPIKASAADPEPPLPTVMTALARHTSAPEDDDEDVTSIDSMAQVGGVNSIAHANANANGEQPAMVLSKKALHQRDADENLFLRFLELDPPTDATAPTGSGSAAVVGSGSGSGSGGVGAGAGAGAGAGGTGGGSGTAGTANATPAGAGSRRLSTITKPFGRTPFTMTKRLTRTAERGFGFSIVWTHPPRVEKVEAGLSADRCGILPGDYVIFVDKHNVVTMPEADVLNLIRSQGATLTLEIFRRSGSVASFAASNATTATMPMAATTRSYAAANGKAASAPRLAGSGASDMELHSSVTTALLTGTGMALRRASAMTTTTVAAGASPGVGMVAPPNARPSTACSGSGNSSIEAAKRRLNLPQVTFSKESIAPITDNRRRILLQLISREQNFISALHFGMQRFVQPLQERKDLISPNDHRTLFQNIDELLRISEDILEQLCNDDQEPQMNFASRVYLSKTTAICAAYKKYCNGIKRADCVLVNKSRQTGSEFISFITEPPVPRKRPDLTMFIHRPLQHFRETLKLMQLLASNCPVTSEEHKNFATVINELQAAYRDITVTSGLMEPLGEGRPLLTLQDLESRMVFTKCKPFTLAVQGRQWIFGGDLSRVEGRSVKPYWTLLFSDIIVFAKVSRDRVLFITEEPIAIANIIDSCFHMRKKTTEFRLTVDPNGRMAESPTGYCAPDLTRTPKKAGRRKSLVLRAPSLELKAVWQNLLQRQIFLVNAALGSTPLSSPLDSPDVLNTLVPLSDIGVASTSIGSMKLCSMDSINVKNQQQHQNRLHSDSSNQIEMLIDEKCRILNKTGTPKSSALHLANWMKGQLDKQQEQARLAAARSPETISHDEEYLLYSDSDQDERITYWTRQQLEKRTKELNLAKEEGHLSAKPNFTGKRLSGVEELSMSDVYSEAKSVISQSHSTTSDSQITVRSSPIVLDKLAVCRHCHKNCQQQPPAATGKSAINGGVGVDRDVIAGDGDGDGDGGVMCNSLKVQHNQSSPNRCCKRNVTASPPGSVSSMSSSTITGDQRSERSSKIVASSSRRETADTESDVAQLITDDLSQSEATDDSAIGPIPSSSSGGNTEPPRRLTQAVDRLRVLNEHSVEVPEPENERESRPLVNGYWSGSRDEKIETNQQKPQQQSKQKPEPPPRKLYATPQVARATTEGTRVSADQLAKATITTTESAMLVSTHLPNNEPSTANKNRNSVQPLSKGGRSPHKSPQQPKTPTSPSGTARTQFTPCHCECKPSDFANTTLSPDELEQQTCKIIESPRQSPKLPRPQNGLHQQRATDDPHRNCRCVCGSMKPTRKSESDDDELSLMLIGLAQIAPATRFFSMNPSMPSSGTTPNGTHDVQEDGKFLPTIAVVPPTPDSLLSQTPTNVWDNSISSVKVTTSTAQKMHINNVPRQAIIENIPDDSCDDSPLDEEPPYRPMTNTLRRYGTMSSLERLPSEDQMDDDNDDADNDIDNDNDNDNDDDDDEDDDDNDEDDYETEDGKGQQHTRADTRARDAFGALSNDCRKQSANILMNGFEAPSPSTKMSFFEESRAFIDKYLGRWNQEAPDETRATSHQTASETDEQLEECTSGATSGEEVWGTPTSGGENDDMQLLNSDNTHSSPTKSSNSLNDDDDTELMMDELLMAPPMSVSTIRGLLPRRRLEPLFEEETESDEEKTQQESEELQKGETTTNGRYLKDSTGSTSSDDEEDTNEDQDEDPYMEEEPTSSGEERLQAHLQLRSLGPRPLLHPISDQMPISVLRGSSCEYLLDRSQCGSRAPLASSQTAAASETTTIATRTTTVTTMLLKETRVEMEIETENQNQDEIATEMQHTPSMPLMKLTSSITNKESATTARREGNAAVMARSPARFVPPPPPPRRLLLTHTDLSDRLTSRELQCPRSSGDSADAGYRAVADADAGSAANTPSATTEHRPPPLPSSTQSTITSSSTSTRPTTTMRPLSAVSAGGAVPPKKPKRQLPSATIIETSLLGPLDAKTTCSTSLPTASMTTTMIPTSTITTTAEAMTTATALTPEQSDVVVQAQAGSGLSPRLEMRLALNHDIMGDEDLICYDPGPDLTAILGHDLSTFQRRTGRDLLNRSTGMSRVQPREAVISFSPQQRNSKMDTPTVNRRPRPNYMAGSSTTTSLHALGLVGGSARVGGVPQPLQPNRNTWSSSASVALSDDDSIRNDASSRSYNNNSNSNYYNDDNRLSDLELLARREMIYCMSQSKSGSRATIRASTSGKGSSPSHHPQAAVAGTASTSSMALPIESECYRSMGSTSMRVRKVGRDESALRATGRANRLISFLKRRNSEVPPSPNCSQLSLNDSRSSSSGTPIRLSMQFSPRKDNVV